MADEKSVPPQDDSKKDTVRINLPTAAAPVGTAPPGGPATVRLKPASTGGPAQSFEEKEATAIIGKTPPISKPKVDTSQVDITGAKPAAPATPRPTVRLRRGTEEPAAPATTVPSPGQAAASAKAIAAVHEATAQPGAMENYIALAAMVLALAVTAYLAYVAFA